MAEVGPGRLLASDFQLSQRLARLSVQQVRTAQCSRQLGSKPHQIYSRTSIMQICHQCPISSAQGCIVEQKPARVGSSWPHL